MKYIAAIFRKDVRHLWPQIAVVWALFALGVVIEPGRGDPMMSFYRTFQLFLSVAQALACGTLLIAVFHEEKLPGDRQYWLTRPFTWKTLLSEKLLFTGVFVNLALLLAQSAILLRAGISPAAHFSALIWKQVFFSAIFILPVAAFAAVTRNLGQVILGAFLVFVPFFVFLQLQMFARPHIAWVSIDWIRTLLMAVIVMAGLGASLLLQYSRRRTILARALIGSTAVLILVPGFMPRSWALSVRSWWSGASDSPVSVTLLDPSHSVANPYRDPEGTITFEFPIRIDGIPSGTEVLPERFSARIYGLGSSSIEATANRFTVGAGGRGQLSAYLRRGIYERLKGKTVELGGTLELKILRAKQSFRAPGPGGEVVAGVGVCFPSVRRGLIGPPQLYIVCCTPFPRVAVYLAGETGRPNWVISPGSINAPIPTGSEFDILDRYSSQFFYKDETELRGVRLYTAQPVAHNPVTYSFRDIRLGDYVR